jgi:hypothetical protein
MLSSSQKCSQKFSAVLSSVRHRSVEFSSAQQQSEGLKNTLKLSENRSQKCLAAFKNAFMVSVALKNAQQLSKMVSSSQQCSAMISNTQQQCSAVLSST